VEDNFTTFSREARDLIATQGGRELERLRQLPAGYEETCDDRLNRDTACCYYNCSLVRETGRCTNSELITHLNNERNLFLPKAEVADFNDGDEGYQRTTTRVPVAKDHRIMVLHGDMVTSREWMTQGMQSEEDAAIHGTSEYGLTLRPTGKSALITTW
jgi:hydroxyacyl-ACP dehydratase HTD2-like protein with hotdog domain